MFETHISVLLGCSSDFETHITVLLGCWGVLQMFETHISVLLGWHWQISEHWGPYRSLRLHARSLKMPRMSF